MSAIAEFYQECASRGLYPVDQERHEIPARYKTRATVIEARKTGVFIEVIGISLADAHHWHAMGDAPADVRSFLECFVFEDDRDGKEVE